MNTMISVFCANSAYYLNNLIWVDVFCFEETRMISVQIQQLLVPDTIFLRFSHLAPSQFIMSGTHEF